MAQTCRNRLFHAYTIRYLFDAAPTVDQTTSEGRAIVGLEEIMVAMSTDLDDIVGSRQPGRNILPGRNSSHDNADVFRVRTAHGTCLCLSGDGSELVHCFVPRSQDLVMLFRPHHGGGLGILYAADPFTLRPVDDPGCMQLIRIVHQPMTDGVLLRDPLGAANLSSFVDWNRPWNGPTGFHGERTGPDEQFFLEPIDFPLLPDATATTLDALVSLLDADLAVDPAPDDFGSADPKPACSSQRLASLALAARRAEADINTPSAAPEDVHLATGAPGRGMFHAIGSFKRSLDLDATVGAVMAHLHGGWQGKRRKPSFGSRNMPVDAEEPVRVFATGRRAAILFRLPYRPQHARFRLVIENVLHPAIMTVSVNGWELTRTAISDRKRHSSRLDYMVPGEAIRTDELALQIRFDRLPPRSHPANFLFELVRCGLDLGPEAEPIDIPDDPAILMAHFESLGDNCEFGFVQRYFGLERIGLLTFAGVKHAGNLLDMLDGDFAGLGDPGTLVATVIDATLRRSGQPPQQIQEFYLEDGRYEFRFHTFKGPQDHTEAEAIKENEFKLRFLRRKFIEDLEDADKIWVFKDSSREDVNEILSLHASLNRHAPNKLFWVTRPIGGRPAGSIEWIAPNLLRGYSFNPHVDAQWFDPKHWLLLCRQAYAAFATVQRSDHPRPFTSTQLAAS